MGSLDPGSLVVLGIIAVWVGVWVLVERRP